MTSRSVFAALLSGALALGTAVTAGAGAAGATTAGALLVRSNGSYYQLGSAYRSELLNHLGLFSLKIVNTGTDDAQYRVDLDTNFASPTDVTNQLYAGSTLVKSGIFFTPIVAPGKYYLLSLKVTPHTANSPYYLDFVQLSDPVTGSFLGQVGAEVDVAATTGNLATDSYLKNGSQAAVGGSVSNQTMSSPALKIGNTATFTLKLQNDTATAQTVSLYMFPDGCGNSYTFKAAVGSLNITDAVLSADYSVPLAAHGSKSVTLTFKYTTAAPCSAGTWATWVFAQNWPIVNEFIQLPVAVG